MSWQSQKKPTTALCKPARPVPGELVGAVVYLAAPMVLYGSPLYDRAEKLLEQHARLVISARDAYRDSEHWRQTWPSILEQSQAVVVVLDESAVIGAGVAREIVDAAAEDRAVVFFTHDGRFVRLSEVVLRFICATRCIFAVVEPYPRRAR